MCVLLQWSNAWVVVAQEMVAAEAEFRPLHRISQVWSLKSLKCPRCVVLVKFVATLFQIHFFTALRASEDLFVWQRKDVKLWEWTSVGTAKPPLMNVYVYVYGHIYTYIYVTCMCCVCALLPMTSQSCENVCNPWPLEDPEIALEDVEDSSPQHQEEMPKNVRTTTVSERINMQNMHQELKSCHCRQFWDCETFAAKAVEEPGVHAVQLDSAAEADENSSNNNFSPQLFSVWQHNTTVNATDTLPFYALLFLFFRLIESLDAAPMHEAWTINPIRKKRKKGKFMLSYVRQLNGLMQNYVGPIISWRFRNLRFFQGASC